MLEEKAHFLEVVEPEAGIIGAILMQFLPGALLTTEDVTEVLAFEIGSLLASIHLNRVAGYGDLIEPETLSDDPYKYFTQKFEEGLDECSDHLPKALLEQCRHYYDARVTLLVTGDCPCIVHRDFRPGNLIIYKGKLQGTIDWAGARASCAEEDFCSLEHGEWGAFSSHKKSFLAGYASIRPIPVKRHQKVTLIGFAINDHLQKLHFNQIIFFKKFYSGNIRSV